MPADLTTRYLGLKLSNPLIVGACPLTGDMTSLQQLETAGAAALVLPSLFEEQIQTGGKRPSDIAAAHRSPWAGANNLNDYNAGPDAYLRHIELAKANVSVPVIASLNGSTRGGWVEFARLIEAAGADAIELNIFYIPTDIRTTSGEVEQRHLDIVELVRAAVNVPLAVKIGPYFAALPHFADRLATAGADGLVLFNRFFEPEFDLNTFDIRPHIEFSRQAEMRHPLRWIAILRNQLKLSLAATSGIHDVHDVIKAVLAGADVAMLVSSLLRYGPDHLGRLLAGLQGWLASHDLDSVAEIRGRMSLVPGENSAGLERANYLEALSTFAASFD